MALLTDEGRFTVGPFARVPAMLDLPEIPPRPSNTVPNTTPSQDAASRHSVDLTEGCMLTKSIRYTHQLAHWVNAVRGQGRDPSEVVGHKKLISDCSLNAFSFRNIPWNLTWE